MLAEMGILESNITGMLATASLEYIYEEQTNLGFWATIVILLNTGWINVLRIISWVIFEFFWGLMAPQIYLYNIEIALGYSHETCAS